MIAIILWAFIWYERQLVVLEEQEPSDDSGCLLCVLADRTQCLCLHLHPAKGAGCSL